MLSKLVSRKRLLTDRFGNTLIVTKLFPYMR